MTTTRRNGRINQTPPDKGLVRPAWLGKATDQALRKMGFNRAERRAALKEPKPAKDTTK